MHPPKVYTGSSKNNANILNNCYKKTIRGNSMGLILKCAEKDTFLKFVFFTDEATFHINGSVNRYNCRIWGSQQPNEIHEYVRDSPKLNVWCGLFHDQVIGPFFFVEKTITGLVYLDMLELFVLPQTDWTANHFYARWGSTSLPSRSTRCIERTLSQRLDW